MRNSAGLFTCTTFRKLALRVPRTASSFSVTFPVKKFSTMSFLHLQNGVRSLRMWVRSGRNSCSNNIAEVALWHSLEIQRNPLGILSTSPKRRLQSYLVIYTGSSLGCKAILATPNRIQARELGSRSYSDGLTYVISGIPSVPNYLLTLGLMNSEKLHS